MPGQAPKGSQSAVQYQESWIEKQMRQKLQPAARQLADRMIGDNVAGLDARPEVTGLGDRGDIAKTIFDRNYSMMRPAMEDSQKTLLTNLQARGMPIGGAAFNDAYGEQLKQTQDTLSRAAMDADIAAGNEQTRLFNLGAAQFDQKTANRGGAMSELALMMGGNYQPVTKAPSGSVPMIDMSGMTQRNYESEMNAYNQRQQQSMATASTLGSAASGLMKCSRNSKDIQGPADTRAAAVVVRDAPLYKWSYRPNEGPGGEQRPHVGPMAEDMHAATGLGFPGMIDPIDGQGILFAALQDALRRIEDLERRLALRSEG